MELQVDQLGPGLVRVRLDGRMDTVGVDQVESRFGAVVASNDSDAMVDLSAVSFVSSMGVRMLITVARAQRARGRRMALYAAQPGVAQTLAMVSLEQIIPIAADEPAARALLAQPAGA